MSTFDCKHRPSPQYWWSELAWHLFWSSLFEAEIYLFPYCRTELYKMPLLLVFWQFSEFKNTYFSDRKFDLDPRGRRGMSYINRSVSVGNLRFRLEKKNIYRTSVANRAKHAFKIDQWEGLLQLLTNHSRVNKCGHESRQGMAPGGQIRRV